MFPRTKIGRPPENHSVIFNEILWFARNGAGWAEITERDKLN